MKRRLRSLAGARAYRPWKNWTVGDVLEGKFTGQSIDQFDKPNYSFEIINRDFEFGDDEDVAKFEPGKIIVLNSCGSLDKVMESVEVGALLEICYQGQVTLEKGKFAGKDAHTLEVNEVAYGEEDDQEETQEEDYGL